MNPPDGKPIFLRTGNELTVEEQLKIAQLTVEALAHLTRAEAILEKMEQDRKRDLASQLIKTLKF